MAEKTLAKQIFKPLTQLSRHTMMIRILASISIVIFVVETLIMILLERVFPPLSSVGEMLVDAGLLVILSTPLLYIFLFRPLLFHIERDLSKQEALQKRLKESLKKLAQNSFSIGTQSDEILAIVTSQSDGMRQTADSFQDFMATLEELARTSKQITMLTGEIVNVSEMAFTLAQKGASTLENSREAMESIEKSSLSITERILALNERSKEIGAILNLIENIMDKTEILALNAALEGTKAGEAGRGFSLVAKEMRRLSERVGESTGKIKEMIQDIQSAISSCVVATEDGVKSTKQGIRVLEETTKEFGQIFEIVEAIKEASNQIALSTQQQNSATEQSVSNITEISKVVQKNVAGVKEIEMALQELNQIAKDLQHSVDTSGGESV